MKNFLNNKGLSLIDSIIIIFLLISSLIFESLKTLSGLFTYGIFKKEILTNKSNLGFDFKIKIK
ncbi:Conserved hypothetical protein [Prochlorococcus marinus str. MIT 9515]|uniref:Uncharacterized protein n=1 Tax=Prochlorococcus marinus (strain MIT 9515) TaxID=167542 RepID=A2BX30_PROM5|nr:Conserved hypothetical protein [Prochlorococcus marinus str. MIT 9515]